MLTILPSQSPLVLRGGNQSAVDQQMFIQARIRAEHQLRPVISIMELTLLAANGFQVTPAGQVSYGTGAVDEDVAEQLAMARAIIRGHALETAGISALPAAVIIYRAAAVQLLGAPTPRLVPLPVLRQMTYEPGTIAVTVSRKHLHGGESICNGLTGADSSGRRVKFTGAVSDLREVVRMVSANGQAVVFVRALDIQWIDGHAGP
jgi:hypothetical protein